MNNIVDFLYDFMYKMIDNKLISIIIFFSLATWAWGGYTYLPEIIKNNDVNTETPEEVIEIPKEDNINTEPEEILIWDENTSQSWTVQEPSENPEETENTDWDIKQEISQSNKDTSESENKNNSSGNKGKNKSFSNDSETAATDTKADTWNITGDTKDIETPLKQEDISDEISQVNLPTTETIVTQNITDDSQDKTINTPTTPVIDSSSDNNNEEINTSSPNTETSSDTWTSNEIETDSGWDSESSGWDSESSGWDSGNSGWDSGNSGWDSGSSGWDSGSSGWDSGSSGWDSGSSGWDSGSSGWDSGSSGWDSGSSGWDSGSSGWDSGSSGWDSGSSGWDSGSSGWDSGSSGWDEEDTTVTTNNGTTPWNTGADWSPVETIVDQYFENEGTFDTGWWDLTPIKVVAVHSRSPIHPIPASCPSWYYLLGYNSNIFNETTVFLPYTQNNNNMSLTNEFIQKDGSDYYFKIYNVNGVKIGWVIYKIWNPNIDYHWSFSICLQS
jgi:hypothetical protein